MAGATSCREASLERNWRAQVWTGSSISILPTPVDRWGLKRKWRRRRRMWRVFALASLGKHEGGRRAEGMIRGQGRGFPGARLAPVYTTNGMDDSSPWLNLFLIQWLPSWLPACSPRLVNSGEFCSPRLRRGLRSHRFEWNFKHWQIPSSWIFTILGSGGEYSWRYRRRSIAFQYFSRDLAGSLGIKCILRYCIRDKSLRNTILQIVVIVSKEIF